MARPERHSHWILLDRLVDIILQNVEGCVVEIGLGKSTDVILKHSMAAGVRYLGCDNSRRRGRWASKLPIELYRMNSEKFRAQFPDIPVALVNMDGSHDYEVVKLDMAFFLARLSPGGVIFLHDTYPPAHLISSSAEFCGDVYRIRDELEQDSSVQIFTWPYTALGCGLSMISKSLGRRTDNKWVARRILPK